jgi:hypothetical protein
MPISTIGLKKKIMNISMPTITETLTQHHGHKTNILALQNRVRKKKKYQTKKTIKRLAN